MVTVDTSTNENLVVWEKKSTAPIASYNIYRESIVAGEYEAVGNVASSELSVFTDKGANPEIQSYTYKITALTADNLESDIARCRPHKTIHLLTSKNTKGQLQLYWDEYFGFNYYTFHIFRKKQYDAGFQEVWSMARSASTTWTDTTEFAVSDTVLYSVGVLRSPSCYPTGDLKAGTGPYNHSLSNLDNNKKKSSAVDDVLAGNLSIYPNPFTERTTLEFENPEHAEYRVMVRDLSGKLVWNGQTKGNRIVIERGSLAAGVYSVEISGKRVYRSKFIVR
jgi:hypothetical protein